MGCVGGLIIGLVTEYFTSHSFVPTRELASACKFGTAVNIIQGLALGYKSRLGVNFRGLEWLQMASNNTFLGSNGWCWSWFPGCIIPVFVLSSAIFVSFQLCDLYGIALAALGMRPGSCCLPTSRNLS